MYVLMHYYNHFEGEIRFGSQSISDIQKKELYRSIALIHQNVVVLDGTLRDNVSLYESYSDENIKQALIRAGMGDYLNEKGLDFTIQESGSNLSGGEKQRISIARAILKDAPIVVLDEATAYADPENEHQIQKAFDGLIKNKTVIMVAHRLSTVQDADQILVMKNGAIAESGTHSDLIKHQGEYAKMWDNYNKTVQWHIES